jgi:hypothetical protein
MLTTRGFIETVDLRRPLYYETARHGHFGRERAVFTWEKTDKAAALKREARVAAMVEPFGRLRDRRKRLPNRYNQFVFTDSPGDILINFARAISAFVFGSKNLVRQDLKSNLRHLDLAQSCLEFPLPAIAFVRWSSRSACSC